MRRHCTWLVAVLVLSHGAASGITQTPPPAAGDAVLSVSNGLSQTTAGAGRTPMAVMLLTDSFEKTLDGSGMSLAAWVRACRTRQPACRERLVALEPMVMDAKVVAPGGAVTFRGVPPGRYYVFGQSPYGNQLLVWDVAIGLQSGSNAVTLDQRNLARLDAIRPSPPAGEAPGTDRPR